MRVYVCVCVCTHTGVRVFLCGSCDCVYERVHGARARVCVRVGTVCTSTGVTVYIVCVRMSVCTCVRMDHILVRIVFMCARVCLCLCVSGVCESV